MTYLVVTGHGEYHCETLADALATIEGVFNDDPDETFIEIFKGV